MGKFGNVTEGVGMRLGPPVETEGSDGYAAFGKPVPMYRRSAAYQHAKDMGCIQTHGHEKVFSCIEAMANKIERDDPHGAMERALKHGHNPDGIVDATGVYRLLAVLCTAEKPQEGSRESFDPFDERKPDAKKNAGRKPKAVGKNRR